MYCCFIKSGNLNVFSMKLISITKFLSYFLLILCYIGLFSVYERVTLKGSLRAGTIISL